MCLTWGRVVSQTAQLPIIEDNCPACFEAPKQRHRVKRVLAAQEHENPELFTSLLRAMEPIIKIDNAGYSLHGDSAVAKEEDDEEEDPGVPEGFKAGQQYEGPRTTSL